MSARPEDFARGLAPPGGRPCASRVRLMQPADFKEISVVENRVYDFPWSRNVFMSCFGQGYEGRVVEWSRAIVGYGIMLVAAAECHLVNLCIDPTFQRRGLGRGLLRAMLDRAVFLGARRVFLEVRPSNAAARALYVSENFHEMSLRRNYYPTPTGREDAVVLTKFL